MDLVPILTRAESLFRRFERAVQAIDKKDNFPAAPTATQRTSSGVNSSDSGKGKSPQNPSVGASTGASTGSSALQKIVDADKPKIISPELRELLRKDIPWRRQHGLSAK